jgi:anthranilate phosphoribosyltransferase
MSPTWSEVLGALVQRQDLTGEQTQWAMGEILAEAATPAQVAGFAVALRAKGETIDEVTGLLEAMYAVATRLTIPGRALDVVGTGGDRSMSVNCAAWLYLFGRGCRSRWMRPRTRSPSATSYDVTSSCQVGTSTRS